MTLVRSNAAPSALSRTAGSKNPSNAGILVSSPPSRVVAIMICSSLRNLLRNID
jgi:hypothetical protein